MRSGFTSGRKSVGLAAATPKMDENYDLKGLNLVAPDQVMPAGETPFAINNRRYADNDDDTSVAMRTRRGSKYLSKAVGETLGAQNVAAKTADILLTPGLRIAIPFTASSTGVLTRYDLDISKAQNTRGYVIIEIYSDSIGLPNIKQAQSSITPSSVIVNTFSNVPIYFMDAPGVVSGQQYWAVVHMQDTGVGTYKLAQVAAGNVKKSEDEQKTWTSLGFGAHFKTYVSTAGAPKGWTKRYPEDTAKLTMFAQGTKLFTVPNTPANPTELGTNLIHATSTKVRFLNLDERTFIIDQVNVMRMWDGVAAPANVTAIPTALGATVNAVIFQNRLLTVPKNDQTRIDFSALYDFTTAFPSVNFFYIGRPKSEDWITAFAEYRDAITVFTKETKYTLTGSEISTFQPTPHVGTKGAISQEAIAVGTSAIYFMADDRQIYSWNGTNDTVLSKKVFPELKKIADLSKVRLHVFNNQLRVYYNRNPDNEVNCMLLYDIAEAQWYKDTGRYVAGSMEWNFDNNELVEFSSRGGWIFYGEQGYSDLGKSIAFKYWTNYKSYGSGAAKDRIKRFRPVVRPAPANYYLNVGKDIDFQNRPVFTPWLVDSGGAQWGTFNWGDGTTYGGSALVDNTVAMSGRGKHTQFRFEYEGIDNPVLILGYIAQIKSGRPR